MWLLWPQRSLLKAEPAAFGYHTGSGMILSADSSAAVEERRNALPDSLMNSHSGSSPSGEPAA